MKVIQLLVDRQAYYLPGDFDTSALQQQILAAVSGPPAFITFRPSGETEVMALITAHTSVRFEVSERPEADMVDVDVAPDIDQYGFFDAV